MTPKASSTRARHGEAFSTFVLVGGLTAVIYFGLFWLLFGVLILDYRVAVSISYLIAVCFHFVANRAFAFKAAADGLRGQLGRYLIMAFANYLVTVLTMEICVAGLGAAPGVGALVSVIAAVGSGYLMAYSWVFRPRSRT